MDTDCAGYFFEDVGLKKVDVVGSTLCVWHGKTFRSDFFVHFAKFAYL